MSSPATPTAAPPDGTAPADSPALRSIASGDNRRFLGHPLGLGALFSVELWERFSYYGMRAILAYYIYFAVSEGGLGMTKATAAVIVTTYGASVYLLSVVGGFLADRMIGARRATLYGGIIIMLGHVAMSIPAGAGFAWLGLFLIALGTGIEKPNIATIVGELYTDEDTRRDAGFEIFYMSVNIGSFISPFLVAALKNRWGFHAGFAAAAVGMAIALVIFVLSTRHLHGAGDRVTNPLTPAERKRLPLVVLGILAGLAVFWLASALLEGADGSVAADRISDVVFLAALVASVYYFVAMYRHPLSSSTDRRHVLAYLPLFIGAAMFWMIFEQAAGYIAVFAESNTQLHAMGITIDPEWYQSVNPLCVVLFAPLFGWFFTRRAGRFPSTPMKFALAVFGIGLSAVAMWALFGAYPGGAKLAPWYLLALVFWLQTMAELSLSPVGLSATTTLAPRHFASQAMAVWYLSVSVGQGLGGQVIKASADASPARTYAIAATMTLVIAAVLFALVPWTRRQMQDVEDMRRRAMDAHRAGRATQAEQAASRLPAD